MAKRKSKVGFLGLSNTTLLLIGGGVALYYLTRPKTENATVGAIGKQIYFKSQASALEYVFDDVETKYDIIFPENIWTQKVPYGKTVRYNLELMTKNGNIARKGLTILLYRMDSGDYELTYYYN